MRKQWFKIIAFMVSVCASPSLFATSGAHVTLALKDGNTIEGELLFARDTSLVLWTGPTEAMLMGRPSDITVIETRDIELVVVKGKQKRGSLALGGGILGGIVGGAAFAAVPRHSLFRNEETMSIVGGVLVGGLAGAGAGWLVGNAVSTDDRTVEPIDDAAVLWLREKARFPEEEPSILHPYK